jgi:hypothetical protein
VGEGLLPTVGNSTALIFAGRLSLVWCAVTGNLNRRDLSATPSRAASRHLCCPYETEIAMSDTALAPLAKQRDRQILVGVCNPRQRLEMLRAEQETQLSAIENVIASTSDAQLAAVRWQTMRRTLDDIYAASSRRPRAKADKDIQAELSHKMLAAQRGSQRVTL